MVRQKCLDLISNLTTVPTVAAEIMRYQSWFLDHLLIMVRDGDMIADKIPALSVLIRLLKVMLLDRYVCVCCSKQSLPPTAVSLFQPI